MTRKEKNGRREVYVRTFLRVCTFSLGGDEQRCAARCSTRN